MTVTATAAFKMTLSLFAYLFYIKIWKLCKLLSILNALKDLEIYDLYDKNYAHGDYCDMRTQLQLHVIGNFYNHSKKPNLQTWRYRIV